MQPDGRVSIEPALVDAVIEEVAAGRMLKDKPTRVVEWSVKGMLPKGSLGRRLGMKLKVYAGPTHPHQAQKPQVMSIPA